MDSNKLTLDDKIDELNRLIERRKKLRSFFYRQKNCEMVIRLKIKDYPIGNEDKESQDLIEDYYKKELEKVNKKLNELLK